MDISRHPFLRLTAHRLGGMELERGEELHGVTRRVRSSTDVPRFEGLFGRPAIEIRLVNPQEG